MSAVPPPPNKTLGVLLAGTYISSCLWSLTLVSYWRFFARSKNGWLFKVFVGSVLLVDTTSLLANFALVYLGTVRHWGDTAYASVRHWPTPLWEITSGIVALMVQSFLIHRIWQLSKSIATAVVLELIAVASTIGVVWVAVLAILRPLAVDRVLTNTPSTIWLVCSVVTDMLIAVFLMHHLRTAKRKIIQKDSAIPATLQKYIVVSVESGTMTATLAVIALVTFLAPGTKNTNICVAAAQIMGRCYALTLSYTLNLRQQIMHSSQMTSSGNNTNNFQMTRNKNMNGGMLGRGGAQGINVQLETFVEVEEGLAGEEGDYEEKREKRTRFGAGV